MEQAVHLVSADRVVLALPAQRDGGLLVERRALADWGPGMKGYAIARPSSPSENLVE